MTTSEQLETENYPLICRMAIADTVERHVIRRRRERAVYFCFRSLREIARDLWEAMW